MAKAAKEPPAAAPARRRGGKWWLLVVGLLGVGVWALPALASTAAGAAFISRQASAAIPGSLALEGVSLSWGGGQAVAKVSVLDPDGDEVATATNISLPDLSLLDLLGGERDPGAIAVESAWAKVEMDEEGQSGLQAALAAPGGAAQGGGPPPWAALLRLQLGSATAEVSHPSFGEVVVEVGAFQAEETSTGVGLSLEAEVHASPGGESRLAEPAEMVLVVESLALPVGPGNDPDLAGLSVVASLAAERLAFAAGEEEPAVLAGLSVALGATELGGGLTVAAKANLSQGGLAAPVRAEATVGGLHDPATPLTWQVEAEATGLPVAAAGVLLGQEGWPALLLGERADLALVMGEEESDGHRGWQATASSPTLGLALAGTLSADRVVTDPAASTVSLQVSPVALDSLRADPPSDSAPPRLRLARPADLQLTRVALDWGFADGGPARRAAASLATANLALGRGGGPLLEAGVEATLSATFGADGVVVEGQAEARLSAQAGGGLVRLQNGSAGLPPDADPWLRLTLVGKGLPPGAVDALAGAEGRLALLLGGATDLELDAIGTVANPNMSGRITSPLLGANLSFNSGQDGAVSIEGLATLALSPEAFAAWVPLSEEPPPRLLAPAQIRLGVRELYAPGTDGVPDWSRSTVVANLEVPLLSIAPAGGGGGALLEELEASVEAGVLGKSARLRASAQFARDGVMAPTSADLALTGLLNPEGAAPGVAGTVRLERLGLGALAALLGAPGSVTALVGESAEATMDLDLPAGGAGEGSALVAVEGDLLSLSLAARLRDSRLALARPATASLRLTPAGFAALGDLFPPAPTGEAQPKPPLRLLAPADLAVTVASLDLPWGGEGGPPGSVALEVGAGALSFAREGSPGQAVVTALAGTLTLGLGPGGQVVAEAGAKLVAGGVSSPATLSLTTRRRDPEAPEGAPPPPLDMVVRGSALPMAPLDLLLGNNGMLEALVGPSGSMDLAMALPANGPGRVDLDLTGAISTVSAHGPVAEAFTLESDALATLEVTPALGERVLAMVNPLLMTALSGDGPVVATVEAATMSLPLRPFSVPDAKADMVVEIGTVVIGHGGLVEAILKAIGQRQPERSLATFTPAHISLREGLLTYAPVTMTMGEFQVSLQGTVEMESRAVAATISLPKASLAPALGDLADLLESDYVLVVPVGGTVDAPELDRGAIGDAIADLLARLAIRALADSLFGG